jgi:hypothetical protein
MNEDENEKKPKPKCMMMMVKARDQTNGTMRRERLGDVGQTSTSKQRKASVEGREGGGVVGRDLIRKKETTKTPAATPAPAARAPPSKPPHDSAPAPAQARHDTADADADADAGASYRHTHPKACPSYPSAAAAVACLPLHRAYTAHRTRRRHWRCTSPAVRANGVGGAVNVGVNADASESWAFGCVYATATATAAGDGGE